MTDEIPSLAGSAEAARILGVEGSRIARYKKAGRMPPSAVCDGNGNRIDLRMSPVWFAGELEATRDGEEFEPRAPLALVGTAEAALICGVGEKNKSQIGRWRREDALRVKRGGSARFPDPVKRITAGPLWWREDVERFAAARHRVRPAA